MNRMDADNDNEQPNASTASSSANSSNNSSSSNLLINLPMMHDDDNDEEENGAAAPYVEASIESLAPTSSQQAVDPAADSSVITADNSVFIPPLLFNNNSTPPLTSSPSTSSTSSSSHNLFHNQASSLFVHDHNIATTPPQHDHHHRQQQIQQHIEHSHYQHSSPPPIQLNHAPSLSSSSFEEDEVNAADNHQHTPPPLSTDEAINSQLQQLEDTDNDNNEQDIASTSQANQQSLPSQSTAVLLTPPTSLPLSSLEKQENKSPFVHPSPISPHPAVYNPSLLSLSSTSHRHHHPTLGSCSNISSNGATMFSSTHQDSSGGAGNSSGHQHQVVDRLKMLYPNVNENETPLPRCWSSHDKCLSIGLSQNNLRVQYKGVGKQHNDAASVRTAYPIPPACGLYYFEVKIISKGKNGYMGIGLTAQQFRMNRLPGWDKQSYGYHGDDGNSFSSSGNGQSYGPTFTTGDIIGCCVNFVNNTCFYTKNGIDLGIAFRDLPSKLYPTVGLQTPGEEVDANFGQEPFKFDQIEDMMKQMRAEMKSAIYDIPMPLDQGDPTTLLHKMVASYLVHNGYSQTADAFARTTGQTLREDLPSIRTRQKILKLVMSGKMGQAIEHTLYSYPGLLESNKNLWFMLKCRQFVEMVNGADLESTKSYQNGKSSTNTNSSSTTTNAVINEDNTELEQQNLKNSPNSADNCSNSTDATSNSKNNDIIVSNVDYMNDVEMENNGHSNGNSCKNGNSANINNSLDLDEEMDIDISPSSRKYSHGIERILEFGRDLSQMGQQLEKENKMNDDDRQMLEDAFSLIAYSNPWSSPLGWQLCPTKRENVCTALNSAILESMNFPRRPPLDVCVAHANELLKVMAQASLGACAFVNIEDIFPQN